MVTTRPESYTDQAAVRDINVRAFGQTAEADIVEVIRANCAEIISLVAVDGDAIVGHILYSPVTLEVPPHPIIGMGLGPMAVHPDRQRQGIGGRLVRDGLALVREQGYPYVVVLGHPEYYPRFGFERASKYGIASQWPGVPEAAFMVIFYDRSAAVPGGGIIRYRAEFDAATSEHS